MKTFNVVTFSFRTQLFPNFENALNNEIINPFTWCSGTQAGFDNPSSSSQKIVDVISAPASALSADPAPSLTATDSHRPSPETL
jgi:hypothetical protein